MPAPDPMDTGMPTPPPMEPPMPQGPGGIGPDSDMIMIDRSSFEDLKEILTGIMAGIDEILAAQPYSSPGEKPEMEEEGEEDEGEDEGGGGEMPPSKGAPSEDEEFLKSLMAEGNNRMR